MAKKAQIVFCAIALIIAAWSPFPVRAETRACFLFTPAGGTYEIGQKFTVEIAVNTHGSAINAAEGTVLFPTDRIKVLSISTAGSILKFWVQDPAFSNTDGTITWSGGLPTPGYAGDSGKLFTVIFQAVNAGSAKVANGNGSILANDGKGTNIYFMGSEPTFTIMPATKTIAPSAQKSTSASSKPITHVSSSAAATSALVITRANTDDEASPTPIISLGTSSDAFVRFEIAVDGAPVNAAANMHGGNYVLPPLLPGSHHVTVRAYDADEKYVEGELVVTVKPLAVPVIATYNVHVDPPRRPFVITGTVPHSTLYSMQKVIITLRNAEDMGIMTAPVDADGYWSAVYDGTLKKGDYMLTAYLADERGARSVETEARKVFINDWSYDTLANIGQISAVGITAVMGLSVIIAAAMFFYSWLLALRKKLFASVLRNETEPMKNNSGFEKGDQ